MHARICVEKIEGKKIQLPFIVSKTKTKKKKLFNKIWGTPKMPIFEFLNKKL